MEMTRSPVFQRILTPLLTFLICGVLLLLPFEAVAAEDPASTAIRSACEVDFPPLCIVGPDGAADGFSVELMRAALKAMGREVTFRTGEWEQVKGWLANGEVECLPLVGRTPEREPVFDFTFPYITLHGAIVVREDRQDVQALSDLKGRRVATLKGDNAEEFLRREPRDFSIETAATFEQALRGLSEGRYDAVVAQRLVALRLIRETGLKNLRVVNRPLFEFSQDFCFAVQEGDKATLALLNEGLALVMADGTFRRLHAKWFGSLNLPMNRRMVIGGDWNFPPYEFLDEKGRPTGYNVELTRAIARAVGMDVEIRLGPWSEILQGLENGEIDAVQGMFYSAERDRTVDFTSAHAVNHCVAVVRKGEGPAPATVANLAGKQIVVQRGDIMHDYALEQGLGDQVTAVETQEAALQELAAGRYDCALVARMTAMYWMDRHHWTNLTIGRRPLLSPEYCYAAPSGQQALLSQLSEGLHLVDGSGEYRRIHDEWMGVYAEKSLSFWSILRRTATILIPLFAILVGALGWLWTLRRQVAQRTAQLRHSQETLAESETRHRALYENAPLPYQSLDEEGRFLDVNPAWLRTLGYERDEVIGAWFGDFLHPDFVDKFRLGFAEFKRVGMVSGIEFTMRHKKGHDVRVAYEGCIGYTPTGRFRQTYCVFRDVTEQKKAEEQLRSAMNLLAKTFDSLSEAVFVIDPSTRAILQCNPAVQRIFGYAVEELVGRSTEMLHVDHEHYLQFAAQSEPVLDQQEVFRTEFRMKRKDGTCIETENTVTAMDEVSNWRQGVVSVVRDISRRKQAESERAELESQLRQAQKMEAVGRLAGGVAHDFNNMLSVILGYTDLALMKLDDSSQVRQDLKEVVAAAQRSADLTRQLLAFARKQTVVPKVLDLNETIESLLNMLRRLIGEDIDLLWHPVAGLWPVRIDPAQIHQILANLVVNARDAIHGVGKITIETGQSELDEDYCARHAGFQPGQYVMLTVSDNGTGMDKETLANIFEPFFTTKPQGAGTGLGLAMIYGIVKQNEGFVNVYSEPGEGTVFHIYLPRFDADPSPAEASRPVGAVRTGNETVLLVEDEAALLALARELLENLGYRVLAADSPEKALELVRDSHETIDLLMTDVVMPGMSGRDLMHELTALRPGLKSLFMSGYTADVIAHRGILDRDMHFLQKPFSVRDLGEKVREALDE